MASQNGKGWIGVDLDGTLAHHNAGDLLPIGEPIPAMLARVKAWLAAGIEVRIVTARVADGDPAHKRIIEEWCRKHVGRDLAVVCHKDYDMRELWDDRAVGVEKNTGRELTEKAVSEALTNA